MKERPSRRTVITLGFSIAGVVLALAGYFVFEWPNGAIATFYERVENQRLSQLELMADDSFDPVWEHDFNLTHADFLVMLSGLCGDRLVSLNVIQQSQSWDDLSRLRRRFTCEMKRETPWLDGLLDRRFRFLAIRLVKEWLACVSFRIDDGSLEIEVERPHAKRPYASSMLSTNP